MTFTRGHYVTQNCILIGTNWVIKETNNPLLVLFCALFVFIIKKIASCLFSGYYGDGFNAIVVFNACFLPDRSRHDYHYVMDNLFL